MTNPSQIINALGPSYPEIKINSEIGAIGHLKVTLRYPDKVVTHVDDCNLIVIGGSRAILAPLYLPGRISDPIQALKVGSGGTLDAAGMFPKTPIKSLSDLYFPLMSVPTSFTCNDSRPSVTFLADIAENQANGSTISEAGLFTASGAMFNIKTFGGIPKNSQFSVHFEWTISVA